MQIGEMVERARAFRRGGQAEAREDVRLLVSEAVGRPVSWVLAHPEAALSVSQTQWLETALDRYREGEALPYLLGWWEFHGRRFQVDPAVLIPRPETESLVDRVLDYLRLHPDRQAVVDVGTGSGCIAVSLAAEMPRCRVLAIDVSGGALRLARVNARAHRVEDRVRLLQADLLSATHTTWDVIVANLPYIPSRRLPQLRTASREPRLALDGGDDGLGTLRRLVTFLPQALRPGGIAALEIDEGQGTVLARQIKVVLPEAAVSVEPDLGGRERFLVVSRPATE
jgi:release factor glutamine methyltransferase